MDNKIYSCFETDYLKTAPFKAKEQTFVGIQTDFGVIRALPGVSGNYFPVTLMKNKKTKPKKPTLRWLQSRVKQLEKTCETLSTENYKQSREFSEVIRERDDARTLAQHHEERYNRQTKAIGLYFAASGSECSTDGATLNYLRSLRSEIFQ